MTNVNDSQRPPFNAPATELSTELFSESGATAANGFEIIHVPAFNDNYIWLLVAPGQPSGLRDVIVVDPGQAQPVIDVLQAQGLRLSAILLTHHHNDHVGGVAQLLAYAAGQLLSHSSPYSSDPLPVYGPAGEEIAHVTQKLAGGDAVVIPSPSAHFTVIDVPGHTRGHIAFFAAAPGQYAGRQADAGAAAQPPRVFCGDTLFATGCGRLFEGTPAQMLASLDRLAALPPETQVYCAHEYTLSNIAFALACDGDNADLLAWQSDAKAMRARGEPTVPTTLAHESRVNPFLRTDQPAILASLEAMLGQKPQNRLEAFTALRAWKDRF
jgi:hydroxyacylglutathione hydrolase